MASSKEQSKKDFFIAVRKKISSGITSAPVWVMQKANKRIWNPKGKRHWSQTDFGDEYRKSEKKSNVKPKKSGKRKKSFLKQR